MREYSHNGFAGCVTLRTSRTTKTLVGVYHSMQAGLERDPDLRWSTVCEPHGTLVCTRSLASAMAITDPSDFCDCCRGECAESCLCRKPSASGEDRP